LDKIYIILGKSSSGKDTIFKKIIEKCDLSPIVYYTTRPIRKNEVDGREYFFVDEKTINNFETNGRLIERRDYDTVNGLWTYATVFDDQFLSQKNGIIVLPPKAYFSFKEYFGDDKIEPIYIHVDDGIRLRRAIERDEKQKVPNYAETCRRFLADEKDFSGLNFEHTFENIILDDCVEEIIKTLGFKLKK
jgi:guanylate kinase